ncbi:MAG: O-antigen ligase family protein [Lachnospiraceae bacterium]|nr:O-antigen ligase family protein [Lachnospiraceae bacterium]
MKPRMNKLQSICMLLLIVFPFFTGLYFEYQSCAASVVLFLVLVYIKRSTGHLYFRLNDASAAVLVLVLFYGISVGYAVDRGLALWGFFKFLPLFLFLLVMFQLKKEERLQLFWQIPFTGAVMTVGSLMISMIPVFRKYVQVSGRLGGFFQYPNTFAMYLLIGLIVLYAGDLQYTALQKTVLTVFLANGILTSGSRTVLVLTAAAVPVLAAGCVISAPIKGKAEEKTGRKKTGILLFIAVPVLILILILAAAAAYYMGVTEYFTSYTAFFSTFWGRLLYFRDALGQIAVHPFGLGYMGYYLTQSSFQTGVYSVMFVHNDLLQILLDVGWIPALCVLAALGKALFSGEQYRTQKLVLIFLGLHSLFDFDLQYVVMFFIMILTWNLESERKKILLGATLPFVSLFILAGVYIGAGNLVYYTGKQKLALKIYPYNSFAEIRLLSMTSDVEELENIAEDLLKRNDRIAPAWDAKAKASYSRGDFAGVLEAKRKALELSPYDLSIYEDYFAMLTTGVELYEKTGDEYSAAICREEIEGLQERLDEVRDRTSSPAWKIKDQPQLEMPEEYRIYLEEMKPEK